jgi:hypothetical protein
MTAHAIGDQQTGYAQPTGDSSDHAASATQVVRDGANEARQYVSGALPAITAFMGRVVYNSCYGVSYGVVFPLFFVARMVPKENAFVHGLIDGANAARDRVDGWRGGAIEDHVPDGDEPASNDHEGENAAEENGHARRRRSSSRRGGGHKARRSTRKSES